MSGIIISGDRSISFDDMTEHALRAANGLEQMGFGPGDALAFFMRNDFPLFEAAGAAGQLGLYAVPINWHYGAEEAGYVLEDCGAKVLVIHADLLPQIEAGIPESVTVLVAETPLEIAESYGVAEADRKVSAGRTGWQDWLMGFEPIEPRVIASPGAMIYTSGTTGRPKGVRRKPVDPSEMEELYKVINIAFELKEGARTIIPAPMYHSAPNSYSGLSVKLGLDEVVLMPRFEPEELLRLIEKHKITHLQTVPTMFVRLLKLPEDVRAKYDVSSLESVVHAAAPCAPETKKAMIEWWGPVINEYYGSTETGSVVFCTSEDWLAHPGTVGKPMPGVELKILDDDGNEVSTGEEGDVYARILHGPDFTYNNDDAKRAKAERAGLIAPGDIGYVDEDGFLFLCDRRNDMVISGGVNIYPAEIESCLISHPEIADCAVFGIPDPDFGEALCAYIQPAPGTSPDGNIVRSYIREHLASYKVPKVIEFVPDLPREDSGKIFKRKLREPYWESEDRRI